MILIIVLTVVALVSIAAVTIGVIALNRRSAVVQIREVAQEEPQWQRHSDTSEEQSEYTEEDASAPIMDLPRLPISPHREDNKWT